MAGQIADWEVPYEAAQGAYGPPTAPAQLSPEQLLPLLINQLMQQRQPPIDMGLAAQPAQVPVPNPFGMGPDYNASPALNSPRRSDSLDAIRGGPPYQPPLDEMWRPLNPPSFSTAPPEASPLLDWLGQFLPRGVDNR